MLKIGPPLKDEVSLLEDNVECDLEQTVVETMVEVVRLEDVPLGAGTGAGVLRQVEVHEPDLAEVLASLLLLADGDPALAGVQHPSVVVGRHLAREGELLVVLHRMVGHLLPPGRLLKAPAIQLSNLREQNRFPESNLCEFIEG